MIKYIVALCMFMVLLFVPAATHASQVGRSLQPGNTYEFTGRDARVITHINSTVATARYDIVAWDAQGNITRFGTGLGRIAVSGAGGVAITPHAPMHVTFDSSRLELNIVAGHVFTDITLAAGQSVSITNNSAQGIHVRTAAQSMFDHVIVNHTGATVATVRESRLPQITLQASNTVTLTAINPTRVYFPTRVAAQLTVTRQANAAITTISLVEGQIYSLSNISNATRSFNVAAIAALPTFSFDYVMRGSDGHVTSHGTRHVTNVQLLPGQSITITPLISGEIIIPQAQLEYLLVEQGELSPRYTALGAGSSITISNSDQGRSHNVFVRCPPAGHGFIVDYAVFRDGQVRTNTVEVFAGGSATINVPPSSQVTITVVEAYAQLEVGIPNIEAITVLPSIQAALTRHYLEQGKSVRIVNIGEEPVSLLPFAVDVNTGIDFVLHGEGDIIAFGVAPLRTQLQLNEGESILLTNVNETAIALHIPTAYMNDIEIAATNDIALVRHQVRAPLQIENRNRLYHFAFQLVNETTRNVQANTMVLEYVRYTTATNIAAFGERGLGSVEVPASQRVVVAPVPGGITPTIIFPAQWTGLRVTTAAQAPLHRISLAPGRSITINNFTSQQFTIQNNSLNTAAGFILETTPPGEMRRVLVFQDPVTGFREYEYRFVRETQRRGTVLAPATGIIEVPAASIVVIQATPGANLELMLPVRWARQLQLLR